METIVMPKAEQRILVIDDCRTAAQLISTSLSHIGFRHHDLAYNYDDALKLCSRNHYQLLIIDYHLNEFLTGVELAKVLENKGYIRFDTSILFVSGDSRTQVILNAISEHRASFILKPFSKQSLKQKVEDLLICQQAFAEIHHYRSNLQASQSLTIALDLIQATKENKRAINFIVQHFRQLKAWSSLKIFCERHAYLPHLQIFALEARYRANEISLAEALDRTEFFSQSQPLALECYDLLFELQTTQKNYSTALSTYEKAITLNPYVTERILKSLDVAFHEQDYQYFIKMSKLFFASLSKGNNSWLSQLAEYFRISESLFNSLEQEHSKRTFCESRRAQVNQLLARFQQLDKVNIKLLFIISQTKIAMCEGHFIEAKKRLLKHVAPYLDRFAALSTVVKVDLLVCSMVIGEFWLAKRLSDTMQLISVDDHYISKTMTMISGMMQEFNHSQLALKQINQPSEAANLDARETLAQLAKHYPLSSDVNLSIIKNEFALGSSLEINYLYQSLPHISQASLTIELSEERDEILDKLHSNHDLAVALDERHTSSNSNAIPTERLLAHNKSISRL